MKVSYRGVVGSAIATLVFGSVLFVGTERERVVTSAVGADASAQTIQTDGSDQADKPPAEQVSTVRDAVLRIAPDPRATVTGQVVAGTPVRVTHQSDRYFYIEVSDPAENPRIEPISGWILDCQLYDQCERVEQ